MSGKLKLKGNWKVQVDTLLKDALTASTEIVGRNGAEATRHAIILMAQSAKKMTPQSKKNRKLQYAKNRRPFLWRYDKRGGKHRKYLPRRKDDPGLYASELAKWRVIRGRGIGKRSWMWGLKGLKGAPKGQKKKPISGVAHLRRILGAKASGFILTNELSYILKVMPAGWQASVVRKAANRILAQAKLKIEKQWKKTLEDKRVARARLPQGLHKYFLGA